MPRVVAIDGPAGAGKSSAARALAERLGFRYVDTGAMYRVVGLLAHRRGVSFEDDEALAALVDELGEALGSGRSAGVEDALVRSAEAGELASRVSTRPAVRRRLVAVQRGLGTAGAVVMEGRDIGTVVFPDAPLKVYLTADPAVRARRRAAELEARGETVDVEALTEDLARRDRRDSERHDSPLRPAADALMLDTSSLALPDVVARMEKWAHERLGAERHP